MEKIEINTKTPIEGFVTLTIENFIERDNELIIKLGNDDYKQINTGEYLTFMRTVNGENGIKKIYQESVLVIKKDENNYIHTELIPTKKTYLRRAEWHELYYNETDSYYLIHCEDEHYLYAQDLAIGEVLTRALNINIGETAQEVGADRGGEDILLRNANPIAEDETPGQIIYLKDYKGNLLGSFSEIYTINTFSKQPLTIEDCIIRQEKEKTCNKEYDNITTYYYSFLPQSEDRHSFILKDFNSYLASQAFYFETKYNPFYYYTVVLDNDGLPVELDKNGNPVKHCRLYGDIWFGGLNNSIDKKYINENPSISNLYLPKTYYSVNLGISGDIDETSLGVEDYFSEDFAKNTEETLIPDFIDMERIKYTPYRFTSENETGSTISGNTRGIPTPNDPTLYVNGPINKITIYPHFRERTLLDTSNNTNTFSSSGNLYYDGWYINTEDEENQYWNGYDWRVGARTGNTGFSLFKNFISTCGKTADLIGYLNFTDNDVFYRKHKVSKSFFRFSFYDSKNPLNQKLLSYSTVFLDENELYYKFVKQKMFIDFCRSDENNQDDLVIIAQTAGSNKNVETVFCESTNVSARVDTKITLTNEYDRTRSAEGFNLYLFAEDIPQGNTSRTIYMRIDFNHAGNGKTVPMIVWPKDKGGQYMELNIDNFIENLYIPVRIKEYKGKYVYTIDGAEYDGDGNMELILFEPKLNARVNEV